MASLTVVILTKNEENHIGDAIKNALACTNQVAIIDSGSTDKTIDIAKNLGASIYYRAWDNDFAAQRNFALECIDTDWILYLDADERMDESVIQAVNEVVKKNLKSNYYAFNRHIAKMISNQTFLDKNSDEVSRLFPVKSVFWVGKVHEHPECKLPKKTLPGVLEHYTYSGWENWLKKMDLYTSIWAKENFEKKKTVSILKIIVEINFAILKAFIFKLGLIKGGNGIISSYQHVFYTLVKYGKLYELQKFKSNIKM